MGVETGKLLNLTVAVFRDVWVETQRVYDQNFSEDKNAVDGDGLVAVPPAKEIQV
jgi:hypothetical protein